MIPYNPTKRGFDYFFCMRGGGHRYHVTLEPMENIWYRDFGLERIGKKLDEVEVPYLTDWLTEDAMNYISRREENDEQPWFVYLAYNCPHGPLQAKDEDIARYPDVEPAGRRTYCAMVDCLDQNVGRLMEHLEKTGEAGNTDAGGDRQIVTVDDSSAVQQAQDLVGQAEDVVLMVYIGHQDEEFIAAQPGYGVTVAYSGVEAFGHAD